MAEIKQTFNIKEEIGRGQFGVIYAVEDTSDGTK